MHAFKNSSCQLHAHGQHGFFHYEFLTPLKVAEPGIKMTEVMPCLGANQGKFHGKAQDLNVGLLLHGRPATRLGENWIEIRLLQLFVSLTWANKIDRMPNATISWQIFLMIFRSLM